MKNDNEKIWYLKYSWDSINDWAFDMKKSAEALLWFDEMLRYFIEKEEPLLSNIDFEIPVNVKKWSWEIWLWEWIFWIWATAYLTTLAQTAWKSWLLETWPAKDIKKIFIGALNAIKWIISIRNHRKNKIKKIEWVKFRNNNEEIGIPNEKWDFLYVPKKYYDLYTSFPENIFFKNTKLIEQNRTLEIWTIENWKISDIKITEKEKYYFYEDLDNNDIILPELIHLEKVELEWDITRTTESTNTIWFKYNWHTLICKPLDKSLAYFKDKIVSVNESHFFSKVKMIWFVDRLWDDWEFKNKKPSILFTDIINIELENKNMKLF
jgi:hypothetical protein